MTIKERILAIRLLEKQEQNPEYAMRIGIHAQIKQQGFQEKEERNAESICFDFVRLAVF